MKTKTSNPNLLQDCYRDGYFHRGKPNPYAKSTPPWEGWEVGKHFQAAGLGFFTIRCIAPRTYRVEDGRTAHVIYEKRGVHHVTVEEREDKY